jgi:hypothetical protein
MNFLDLLRAGHTEFVLNDAAFDCMRTRALPTMMIASLAAQPERLFANQASWAAQLDRLGFTGLTTAPDPVKIATESLPRRRPGERSGAVSTRTTSCAMPWC